MDELEQLFCTLVGELGCGAVSWRSLGDKGSDGRGYVVETSGGTVDIRASVAAALRSGSVEVKCGEDVADTVVDLPHIDADEECRRGERLEALEYAEILHGL